MKNFPRLCTFSMLLAALSMGWLATAQPAPQASNNSPQLLVVNQGDYTLSIVNPATGAIAGSVPTGNAHWHGHEVAVSPDGRTAWVPIYGNAGVGKPGSNGRTIVVIDVATRRITGHIDMLRGVRPHCPVYDSKRNLLYITTELNDSVSILDPKTGKILGSIPTGQPESHMFVLSHDGKRGYTANVGPGTVSVLDMEQRKTLAVLHVAPKTQRISISADDRLVFTSDQSKPELVVIDTRKKTVKTRVPMPSTGYGSAATPNGHWLLVALPHTNQVAVVDVQRLMTVRSIPVCVDPQEILMQPGNADVAYVSCMQAGVVGVLNLRNWTMQRTLHAGREPDGLGWAQAQ